MSSVVFTRAAQTDLSEIWLFLAEENFVAADEVLDTIERELKLPAIQPLMGRERLSLPKAYEAGLVQHPTGVSYLPDPDGITVIRVLHHARDIQAPDVTQ